ncbi:MAG: hypothetical protein ISS25_04185 [Nanoarchaeota archaeon]|nr:hypothetical protein [DPANN group archaeon]MBL7117000.1 hypothetical protein [Nanoarchaeota archaeon]
MTWIEERKNIAELIRETNYRKNSFNENKKLLEIYKSFLFKWDEDSEVDIIKRTKKAYQNLEEFLETQIDINKIPEFESRENFSLTTYLNTTPSPKNTNHARLRNILLGGYDENCWDALQKFSYEINILDPPETPEELEHIQLIFTGLELALNKGFLGRELRRNNKYKVVSSVTKSMNEYLNQSMKS